MNDDIELRIARTEREYDEVTNAAFIAKTRLRSLTTDRASDALQVARARALLESLETKRTKLRKALDLLEREAERSSF